MKDVVGLAGVYNFFENSSGKSEEMVLDKFAVAMWCFLTRNSQNHPIGFVIVPQTTL